MGADVKMNKRAVEKNGRARIGRPTKTAKPGKRMSLGLKVTPQIKARLDNAARETGRTQSQEAELRLERSFDREDLLTDVLALAYGKEATEPIKAFGQSWLQGTVETRGDINGNTFVFVLEGDADEAVTRKIDGTIPLAEEKAGSTTCTLNEYYRLARINSFKLYSADEIVTSTADAILNMIKSSRKLPSREALADLISCEMRTPPGRADPTVTKS